MLLDDKNTDDLIETKGAIVLVYDSSNRKDYKRLEPIAMRRALAGWLIVLKSGLGLIVPYDKCVIIDPYSTDISEMENKERYLDDLWNFGCVDGISINDEKLMPETNHYKEEK